MPLLRFARRFDCNPVLPARDTTWRWRWRRPDPSTRRSVNTARSCGPVPISWRPSITSERCFLRWGAVTRPSIAIAVRFAAHRTRPNSITTWRMFFRDRDTVRRRSPNIANQFGSIRTFRRRTTTWRRRSTPWDVMARRSWNCKHALELRPDYAEAQANLSTIDQANRESQLALDDPDQSSAGDPASCCRDCRINGASEDPCFKTRAATTRQRRPSRRL